MLRRLVSLAALLPVLVLTSTARAGSIWTPITSGTTGTISSIAYQSPTRFWYATSGGTIAFFNGSGFTAATVTRAGENFVDLAFQPASATGGPGSIGLIGLAITSNGDVWRSTDGGVSWVQLASPMTRSDCSSGSTSVPETELNSVQWADATTAYLEGNNSTILKSTNSGATFTEVNKQNTGTCAIQQETFAENFTDATFLPANQLDALFVAQDFGRLYASSNGAVSGHLVSEGTVNNYSGNPRIAQDANNPNRVWVVDHQPGGTGCGELCLELSSDGGNTSAAAKFANDPNPIGGLYDISSQGGVEVSAGSGGEIFTSVDGTDFYNQPADGALATENWRAEAAYDAQHAAVGGENGALAVTAAANSIPDLVPPTGSISGPSTVNSGTATTYTANVADNAGGSGINPSSYTWAASGFAPQHGASATFTFPRGVGAVTVSLTFADNAGNQGSATLAVTVNDPSPAVAPPGPPTGANPVTVKTGGATIRIFRVVFVTGRSARYVPVSVSVAVPRKVAIQILPLKAVTRTALATGRLTLRRRHGGRGTIQVALPAKLKPGTYRIVAHVMSLSGKTAGRVLSFKFVLK